MQLSVEEQGALKRKITVEVPLPEVQAAYDHVYAHIKSHISVRGFRPGKFPRQMAEKRFKEVMREEATRSLLPKYFQQALDEMNARPATQPRFDNLEIEQARPFKFEAEFEIVPTFALPDVTALTVETKEVALEPAEVDERIDAMRGSRATFEEKEDGGAEEGDVVVCDFVGTVGGEPFEGNTGNEQRIELGAGRFLPDFEAPLQGVTAGETKTFDVNYPEDYGQPDLAGKTAQFEVTVSRVERKVLPEVDAGFISQFGQHESVEAFRAEVEKQIREEKQQANRSEYKTGLAEQLKGLGDFDVPESLVEQNLAEWEARLGQEQPEVVADPKKLEAMREEERATIVGSLRLSYIMDAWAREHEITVAKEEVQQRFFLQAYMMRQDPRELMNSEYGQSMLFHTEQHLLNDKVMDDLLRRVLGEEAPTPEESAAPSEGPSSVWPRPDAAAESGEAAGAPEPAATTADASPATEAPAAETPAADAPSAEEDPR